MDARIVRTPSDVATPPPSSRPYGAFLDAPAVRAGFIHHVITELIGVQIVWTVRAIEADLWLQVLKREVPGTPS